MFNLSKEITDLLISTSDGRMMNTAYDTAWLALVDDQILSLGALDWIRNAQTSQGGWGSNQVTYGHDIIVCSLASIISLIEKGSDYDTDRIESGIKAIERSFKYIKTQITIETVGFELIVPQLIDKALSMGARINVPDNILKELIEIRNSKLSFLMKRKINKEDTVAFSLEMFGDNAKSIIDNDILETNGSICNSPSATIYYLLSIEENDQSLQYLKSAVRSGGVPNVAQFDIFERAWVLWNIAIACNNEYHDLYQPHLDLLEAHWSPDRGIGWSTMSSLCDADDSGLVYEVMASLNRPMNIDPLYTYERSDYFQCYKFEQNPSISANIHVLGALVAKGSVYHSSAIEKIKNFLIREQNPEGFWLDKWHASPFYPTAHAVITCLNFHPRQEFVTNAIRWLIESQRPAGNWGIYGGSQEETAYALQALVLAHMAGVTVDKKILQRGLTSLEESYHEKQYPALWIGKCLYAPDLVIRSAILSAIVLARKAIYQI